jgi:rhodanese-related sulfurtransferase
MKTFLAFALVAACILLYGRAADPAPAKPASAPANPLIDYQGFEKVAAEVAPVREKRRLTEEQFAAMAKEPGAVVLDARSADKFAMRHIAGAVSLPFTDFTAESLAKVIPKKDTPVLIYCNNNFSGARASMMRKKAAPADFVTRVEGRQQQVKEARDRGEVWGQGAASLNISTYIALATYGYTNVYELGPLLNVNETSLPFVGTEISGGK